MAKIIGYTLIDDFDAAEDKKTFVEWLKYLNFTRMISGRIVTPLDFLKINIVDDGIKRTISFGSKFVNPKFDLKERNN